MSTPAPSDGPAPLPTFAQSLTNMMAASCAAGAVSSPVEPMPRLDESVRGRIMAPMQKTYSYSPTSEAESDEDGFDEFERSLLQFLQRSVDEHVSSSPLPADSPDAVAFWPRWKSEMLHFCERLLDQLQPRLSTRRCNHDMEVDSLGVATAVSLPPSAHIINPSQVLPPPKLFKNDGLNNSTNSWTTTLRQIPGMPKPL